MATAVAPLAWRDIDERASWLVFVGVWQVDWNRLGIRQVDCSAELCAPGDHQGYALRSAQDARTVWVAVGRALDKRDMAAVRYGAPAASARPFRQTATGSAGGSGGAASS